jgi:sterol desaturase/sphingolipid hydroxylase (fatty acid hydroxylase superfamily)
MNDAQLLAWAGTASTLGLGLAAPLLLAEGIWPRSVSRIALGRRWLANLAAFVFGQLTLRWLPQLSLITTALVAHSRGWGLFNVINAPAIIAIAVSWLAIDLAGYLVHRAEHVSPLLWRAHRVHHMDPDVDVTTTYRFHPFEILLRVCAEVCVGFALGIPLAAAVGYLVLTSLVSPLSHTNAKWPALLESVLGLFVITPDLHRTHHSFDAADSNTNFSVCLSCWDRLFGTFAAAPRGGWERARFGVPGRTADGAISIPRMLADPFLPERLTHEVTRQTIRQASPRGNT